MEDEREPLGRPQRLEHDEQSEADGVRDHGFVLRVRPIPERDDGLRQPRAAVFLAAGPAGAQHVEADAAHDRREPAAQIVDAAGVGTAQPKPGLLKGVVRFAHRAKHPVRHRLQVASILLELPGQPVLLAHCHILSSRSVIALTNPTRSM